MKLKLFVEKLKKHEGNIIYSVQIINKNMVKKKWVWFFSSFSATNGSNFRCFISKDLDMYT